MLVYTGICLLLLFWTSLFLLDYTLRSYNLLWYINFADKIGLQISPIQVSLLLTHNVFSAMTYFYIRFNFSASILCQQL